MNWKRLLKFGKDQALGLDIGSFSVKIVRLRRDSSGYTVTAAGTAAITQGEQIKSAARTNTVRAIRECFKTAAAPTKLAVCGVRGPEVAVRDFEFPSLPAEEVEGAIMLEASQVCPFNTEDGTVDYQLMPEANGKTRGVLVAATNSLMKSRVQLAKEASLIPLLVDVDGLALLNCLSECEKSDAGPRATILNVGASYATLAVLGEDGRPFIRDMTYAGNDIVNTMALEQQTAPETVRQILSGSSDEDASALGESLERASEQLITNVTTTSRYYKNAAKPSAFEKILVCGGFALANGFVDMLNRRLGVEAVLWNPFETMSREVSPEQELMLARNGPALVVAAGLAMRSI